MYSKNNYSMRTIFTLLALLAITACSGGGGGGSDTPDVIGGPGGIDNSDNPNVVNGFNLSTASFTLTGPNAVGTGSVSNYTATLLDSNGVPPISPPGIPVELSVSAGSTNPPGSGITDNNGIVNFTFRAPNNGNETVVRARIRNRDGDFVLNRAIAVDAQANFFQFSAPPADTQVRNGASREIRLNWLIGNNGATTGTTNQGNPSAVRLTLEGRSAGGGFRIGGAGPVLEPASVNIDNGEFADTVEVVAGDASGPVDVIATATTDSQNLRAERSLVFVGVPARLDPTPTNIRLARQESTPLNVRVFDQNGAPLSNIPLRFNISICVDDERNTTACTGSGEQITNALRTTDSTGRASTGFIAGDSSGGGEIEITVDSGPGAGLQRAIVYNVSTETAGDGGGTGGGTAGTTQTFNSPANGTRIPVGESRTVAFNISNASGPVAGQSVTFSITRGLLDDNPNAAPAPAASRSFTSNGAGNITFQVSSTEAGLATLSSGLAELDLEFTQPPAALSRINATTANAPITPGATNTITATAFDSTNNPLPSTFLQFVLDGNTVGGSIAPMSGTTNAQGQLTTTFTAGTGTGTVNIRATNQDQTISFATSFEVSSSSNSQFSNPANGAMIPTTQRQDVNFMLNGGAAAAGQQVTFTIDRGLIDDDFNADPAESPTRTFTADASGVINFGILSFDAGAATLQATGAGVAQISVQFVAVGSIDNQANPQTLPAGQTSTITVTTRDANGALLPGVLVNFIIDFDGTGGSSVAQSQVTSNAQGQAINTFTAGPNSGTVQLRAANGNQSVNDTVTVTVTVQSAAVRRAQFNSPADGQQFDVNTPVDVTFNLSNSDGSPAADQSADFIISGGVIDDDFGAPPAASTNRTFTTDAGGNIAFQIMSDQAGSFQVTAQGSNFGTGLSGRFAAQPTSIDVVASPTTIAPNQSSAVTATLRDNAGNPIAQRTTVDFIVESGGGTITPPADSRTSQGTITADYVAGANTGPVQIRATATTSGVTSTVTINVQ